MSFYLIDIAYAIPFSHPSQKHLLVRMAGYANDEGAGIWPSTSRLAYELQVHKRTVQHNLAGFKAIGLLHALSLGGRGPGDTAQYCLNVDLMIAAATHDVRFEGAKTDLRVIENTPAEQVAGIKSAPKNSKLFRLLGVASGQLGGEPCGEGDGDPQAKGGLRPSRVASGHDKDGLRPSEGWPQATQISRESQRTLSAGARGSGKPPSASALKRVPQHTITKHDLQWQSWVTYLNELVDADDLVATILMAGEICASRKWPPRHVDEDVIIHTVAKPHAELQANDISARIQGEAPEQEALDV